MFPRKTLALILLLGGTLLLPYALWQFASSQPSQAQLASSPPAPALSAASPSPRAPQEPILPVGLEVGMRAPDFVLTDLTGKEVHLSQLQGKGIILNFWSTWCKPCRTELPMMESFYQNNRLTNGIEILAISINREQNNTVKDFVERIGLTFPVLLDFQKRVAKTYKIFVLPTSFLIDRRGVIVKKFFGEIDLQQPKEVLAMLNGDTPKIP
ncbi:MAG: redoxin domain-containing protein [Candidatus Tectomicrobia bacterium]|uniref:Redoxin domain-containing protein n=1 Tax=Tectimicrobiota bacterium TaxID=2528274 RepID=A0A932CMC5_UNCTE|nr:redoxin domain-containing protein [Candidatus Tectomicrobia bacterium]